MARGGAAIAGALGGREATDDDDEGCATCGTVAENKPLSTCEEKRGASTPSAGAASTLEAPALLGESRFFTRAIRSWG